MNDHKILTQGELNNGTWQLLADGTLLVQGHGCLRSDYSQWCGSYDDWSDNCWDLMGYLVGELNDLSDEPYEVFSDKYLFSDFSDDWEDYFTKCSCKIKRLEVCGFDTIAPNSFSHLPFLKEVILDESVKVIGDEAFYGCCQLGQITMAGDVQIGDNAFDGIPIDQPMFTEEDKAAFEEFYGVPYEHFPLEHPLEYTERVTAFWDKMKECLDGLEYGWYNKFTFVPAIQLLKEGAQAKDPALMFLWAELLFWGTMTGDGGYEGKADYSNMGIVELLQTTRMDPQYGLDAQWYLFKEDKHQIWYGPGPAFWYRASAEAGYLPAICWMGWCAMRGIGMEKDLEQAKRWFHMAKELPPVEDFFHDHENLFWDCAVNLGDEARAEDIDEDMYESGCGTSWRQLFAASLMAYKMGCELGNPRCAVPQYAYPYDDCDSLARRGMCVEKRMWQMYCAVNGIGLKNVRRETLRSWREDIEQAIHGYMFAYNGSLTLDKEMEMLLADLTREALCR